MLKTVDMIRLDATGLTRPMPIVQARRILQKMAAGEILEVRADDDSSVRDFPAFCETSGHHMLMVRDDDGVLVFEIEKGA